LPQQVHPSAELKWYYNRAINLIEHPSYNKRETHVTGSDTATLVGELIVLEFKFKLGTSPPIFTFPSFTDVIGSGGTAKSRLLPLVIVGLLGGVGVKGRRNLSF